MVKNYYGGMAKALVHLFPNIGLEESKFREYSMERSRSTGKI